MFAFTFAKNTNYVHILSINATGDLRYVFCRWNGFSTRQSLIFGECHQEVYNQCFQFFEHIIWTRENKATITIFAIRSFHVKWWVFEQHRWAYNIQRMSMENIKGNNMHPNRIASFVMNVRIRYMYIFWSHILTGAERRNKRADGNQLYASNYDHDQWRRYEVTKRPFTFTEYPHMDFNQLTLTVQKWTKSRNFILFIKFNVVQTETRGQSYRLF